MADDIRELTGPEDIRGYFAQFSEILRHLAAVNVKERQTAVRDAWENDIVLDYLKALSGSMHALGMKYGFSGFVSERLPSDLEIDVRDSGFPTTLEIRRLENDVAEAVRQAAEDADGDLRADMVDFVLRQKKPPRELQFRQSQRVYRQLLRASKLFTTRLEPTLVPLEGVGPSGLRRVLLHWAVYDGERNHPVIYIMLAEENGAVPLAQDAELLARIRRVCLNQSQCSLKLLTIGSEIDKEFESLRLKSLKRIIVGPMYSSRFTELNEAIAAALSPFQGDYLLDWVFGWTTEILRSKGSKKVSTGMFGSRLVESFDVDPKNHQSIETGTTECSTRVVMPYAVFQAIAHHPDNPLNDVPKYVIDHTGHVACHM